MRNQSSVNSEPRNTVPGTHTMTPPSEKKIVATLRSATLSIFKADKDSLTVRSVRDKAAEILGLDEGFFAADEWKAKSKDTIKSYAVSSYIATMFHFFWTIKISF